jgi:inosine-uridine nucleoside N-ribohydrolase
MLAILFAALGIGPPAEARTPVILTTDCGVEVDDQWALTHLALSPRIDLRAVVATHAPGHPAEAAARSARDVLARLRLPKMPPVVAGSGVPLDDRQTARRNPGVELILRESQTAGVGGAPVVVLAIGAATDVASALLADPTLERRIRVVAMGFPGPDGGEEWNVKNDVKAWQVVLGSGVPLVVGDGTVCKRDLALSAEAARRRLDGTGPAGQALVGLLDGWLRERREVVKAVTGAPDAWPIWDQVTVAYLLGLAEGREVPRPAMRDDMTFDRSRPRGSITWVSAVRTDDLWSDLAACLRRKD